MAKALVLLFPTIMSLFTAMLFVGFAPQVKGFMPLTRTLWDNDLDDPFRVLEQTPLPLQKQNNNIQSLRLGLVLARADWKETQNAHVISLDIPGMNKQDVKIEVEENRVLKVSGEKKAEEEQEGDRWHRAERAAGRFWRQFRLPVNADLDHITASLQHGVLRITVPKIVAEDKRKLNKVIDIVVDDSSSTGQDVKTTAKSDV